MTVTEGARRTMGLSWTADGRVVPSARRRLVPVIPRDNRLTGWLATLGVTALAAFLRFWHLGTPAIFQFDETYYAKDSYSLWHHGYTTTFVADANDRILEGRLDQLFGTSPSFYVHPEVGKWLIGGGEWIFGLTPFGWRAASAIVGSLMVLVMVRLVRRLTGSTLLGCTAGLLLTFDGLHFVMSRLALLDIFVAFFLLAAVSCLVADRDWGRLRMSRMVPPGHRTTRADWGPVRGLRWRPWRLAAGVLFGLAIASKWSAIPALAAFGILVVVWDAGARRAIGVRLSFLRAAVADGIPAFLYLVVVAGIVYVLSWSGWLLHAHEFEVAYSDTQYGPYWGDYIKVDASGFFPELWQSLRSLWHFQHDVYSFHKSFLNDASHIYQSKPQGWLILNRPVGVAADLGIKPGTRGCEAAPDSTCLRQVILLGTPALWWGGVVALVYAGWAWLVRRDWRYGVAMVGVLSTWLPWVRYDDRPIFSYYAVAIIPFTVIAITLLLGELVGGPRATPHRRALGTVAAGSFVVLVMLNFAWFWPIYTNELITNAEWLRRIWFRQWI